MTTEAKKWGQLHNAQRRLNEIVLKGFAVAGLGCWFWTMARIAIYLVEKY